jgi:pimeloyl-ACP methyl ester carboxylesterase
MATFVLIHGAGDSSWYWHLLDPELRARGHDVVAVDLPSADESAGLAEYTDAVVNAVGGRTDLVVVAHSFGGFTGPLVCARLPATLLVLLAGMVPAPGEPPQDWWDNTGYARDDDTAADDDIGLYYHHVPPDVAAVALTRGQDQSGGSMAAPWPLDAWPDVPTRFLLARDDRFFPAAFQRRVVRERLGIEPDEMPGSHCVALSRPRELADRLEAYLQR